MKALPPTSRTLAEDKQNCRLVFGNHLPVTIETMLRRFADPTMKFRRTAGRPLSMLSVKAIAKARLRYPALYTESHQ